MKVTPISGEKIKRTEPANPRLVPIAWADVSALPRRQSIVQGLLDRGAMSVVYGGSNTGKTFFVLDLTLAVARGIGWRERTVRPGAVIYIAAEGGLGIEERLTAYRVHHEVDATQVPFWLIPEPINLCKTGEDVTLLIARLAEIKPPVPIEIIVVDTLSRAMAGGNENSPDDMGAFVRNIDRLRIQTKAHVLVIHHAGKDEGKGARGHSLLKAAADTEIEVTKNTATGIAIATVAKQRDHRGGETFAFRLDPVEIGQETDGHTITSCVVMPTEDQAFNRKRGPQIPKSAATALRCLSEAIDECGTTPPATGRIPGSVKVVTKEDWRKHAYRRGLSSSDEPRAQQQAFKRAYDVLVANSQIGVWDEFIWIPNR